MSDMSKVPKAETPQIRPEAIEASQSLQEADENAAPPEAEKDAKVETPRHYYPAERFR